MLDQKFVDRIEELRHHTYSRITEMQRNLCPMAKDIYMHYQFEYWYEGYKYNLWEDDKHLYAVNEIPYCYDNELKNTTFTDTLDNLVAEGKVWPFLLFIDGSVIQWSKIHIIHDYDYSYMKIDDISPDYSFYARIVVFPVPCKQIRYGEDNNILVTSDRKGLYFNEGKRLENTDLVDNIDLRFEILDNDIYFNIVDISKVGKTLSFDNLPDGFIPTMGNILVFNQDGTFNSLGPSEKIEDLYSGTFGLFKVLEGSPEVKWAVLMYNTASSKHISSVHDRISELDHKAVINLLKENPDSSTDLWQKIIAPLIKTFDFDHDKDKSYEDNINYAVKYITKYDFRLWKDTYLKGLNVKSFYFTGANFKKKADDKGFLHISRKYRDIIENTCIVFVNHKLYQYMIDVTYTSNTINIPIFGILDDDAVEVLMFARCNNHILDVNVPDADTPIYIHPEYDLKVCDIMSEYCPDPSYNVPDNLENRKQYIVDFTYKKEGSMYKIEFDRSEYYGMDLKIVPKRQYRYYRFKEKSGQSKFILPTQFNYCHDPRQYMIFINGKKIDQTEYAITFMNKWRPFDKLVLYVSTILDEGDYIDVLYIPENFVEKYKKDSIDNNGILMLEDTDRNANYPTTYPMTKDSVLLFVNGLKVNPIDIRDVDINTLLINVDKYKRDENGNNIIDGNLDKVINNHYVNSVDNVAIMEFVPGDKEVAGYLDGLYDQIAEDEKYDPSKIDFDHKASDSWRSLVETLISGSVEGTSLETIFGKIFDIEDPAPSYKENFADLRSVLYDAVIDYYLSTDEATTGSIFTFDFERDHFDFEKPGIDTKHINLFPDKDKLFDYEPIDTNADSSDVIDGKKFIKMP